MNRELRYFIMNIDYLEEIKTHLDITKIHINNNEKISRHSRI